MAQDVIEQRFDLPEVRRIRISELNEALALGIDDFKHFWFNSVILLALIIPLAAMLVGVAFHNAPFLHLIFPLISGLSLVAPIAAIAFYQESRWREQIVNNQPIPFYKVSGLAIARIAILATVLFGILAGWLLLADGLYRTSFDGVVALSPKQFWDQVYYTSAGQTMAVTGTLIGLCFAFIVFCLSVTSFPMLIDRDVPVFLCNRDIDKGRRYKSKSYGILGRIYRWLFVPRELNSAARVGGSSARAGPRQLAPL